VSCLALRGLCVKVNLTGLAAQCLHYLFRVALIA
jgi:hypothetical protein